MAAQVYLNSDALELSTKALALFNYIIIKEKNAPSFPSTLGGIAKWVGVHRTTVSHEVQELFDKGFLEKANVCIDEGIVEARVLSNVGGLKQIEVEHDDALRKLTAMMYSDMSIMKRSQRLSPVNTLFLTLLLAYADEDGYIKKLSQVEMRKRVGFTDAQLKSQMTKLRRMDLLNVLVPGGAFQSISGRVTSILKIELETLRQLLLSPEDSQASPSRSAGIHSLDCIALLPELFEGVIPHSDYSDDRHTREVYPRLKTMEVEPDVIDLFFSYEAEQRRRFYRHLTALCVSYLPRVFRLLGSNFHTIREHGDSEYYFELIRSDEALSNFDAYLKKSLKTDLNLVTSPTSFLNKLSLNEADYLESSPENQEISFDAYQDDLLRKVEFQIEAFIKALSDFTWVAALELYSKLTHIDNVKQAIQKGITIRYISADILAVSINRIETESGDLGA